MLSSWKKLLSPLFNVLATPGLGNPHSPYEAELMASGAKPVAIMGPEQVNVEMQEAIDSGQVVLIEAIEIPKNYRIFCQPDEIEHAQEAAILYQKSFNEPLNEDERAQLNAFFLTTADGTKNNASGDFFHQMHSTESRLRNHSPVPEIDQLLQGEIKTITPLYSKIDNPAIARLDNAVKDGTLACAEVKNSLLLNVFA